MEMLEESISKPSDFFIPCICALESIENGSLRLEMNVVVNFLRAAYPMLLQKVACFFNIEKSRFI
jgi:FPC/CPF motif-containing protein YcgG